MSRRKETVDCFTCSASSRICDRIRHRCSTCSKASEICGGYPRDLQWLTGVKSRGKEKGLCLGPSSPNRQWHPTTPTTANQPFVFKQGKPRKTRQKKAQKISEPSPPRSTYQKNWSTSPQSDDWQPFTPTVIEKEQSPVTVDQIESPSWPETSTTSDDLESNFEKGPNPSDSSTCLPIDPADDAYDVSLIPLEPDPSMDGLDLDVYELYDESEYQDQIPCRPGLLLPSLESSALLTWYNEELCTLPLTSDFHANPFRLSSTLSQGPTYLVHAVLALSMQHVFRVKAGLQGEHFEQQLISYKQSATQLCNQALLSAFEKVDSSVIDTILILFAHDTLFSAVGPWKDRLSGAYNKIEMVGGPLRLATSSRRLRAQLAMFVWWDCSIALVSRSECVFPSAYYDLVLANDNDSMWSIFTVSGVPRELFQYCRELAHLASEKEQIAGLRYARFDTTRVLEIESCIRGYTEGESESPSIADSEELVQHWHDICNAGNAWKYALLLYISRVFKWDRSSDSRLPEITSLARLVLDSVRCCRPDSPLQKQLLFPVFLAGSECVDSYSREFVESYCEGWYQKIRYNMFREGLSVLKQIWSCKDDEANQFGVWWGPFVGTRNSGGPMFLFG